MGSKEEWKELEEWDEKRKENYKAQYGFNYEDIKHGKRKGIDNFTKFLKAIGISYKVFAIIVFSVAFVLVAIFLYFKYISIKNMVDIDIEEIIEGMYNINIENISKDIDKNKNGKYYFKAKENNIKFVVIKNFGGLSEDYIDNCQKYFFNNWNSKSKESFKVTEEYDEILNYAMYIEINNYDELISGTEKIIEFSDFCKFNQFFAFDIYLKYNEKRIYLYNSSNLSNEQIMSNAKESFKNMNNLIGEN